MGHHAHDIALTIENSGDGAHGAVEIFAIAENDAIFRFEFIEDGVACNITTFAVGDGKVQYLAYGGLVAKRRMGRDDFERNGFADVFQLGVADKSTGKQAGFGEDLKAVADAEDGSALAREVFDGGHDGREFRDGSAAEIVAVGETTGKNDRVDVTERGGIVPDEFGGLVQIFRDGVPRVVVAIASRKDDDPDLHREISTLRLRSTAGRGCRFFATGAPFFDGRLAIALF